MAKTFKITEIRITAGKDTILLEPEQTSFTIEGKSGELPAKLAEKLFKTIASQAEQYFQIFRGAKASDFKT